MHTFLAFKVQTCELGAGGHVCPLQVLNLSRYHLLVWPVVEGQGLGACPGPGLLIQDGTGGLSLLGQLHRVALVGPFLQHSVICCAIFIL